MPWTLIGRLFGVGGMALEKVAVTSLRDNLFLGSLWVRAQGEIHEIDARPSDAIALALDHGVRGRGSLPEPSGAHAARGRRAAGARNRAAEVRERGQGRAGVGGKGVALVPLAAAPREQVHP